MACMFGGPTIICNIMYGFAYYYYKQRSIYKHKTANHNTLLNTIIYCKIHTIDGVCLLMKLTQYIKNWRHAHFTHVHSIWSGVYGQQCIIASIAHTRVLESKPLNAASSNIFLQCCHLVFHLC